MQTLIALIGFLLVLLGIFLFFGNVSGSFITFPFAGFIVMTLGGVLLEISNH